MEKITISSFSELWKLEVLLALWYRSSLRDRGRLDQWMIDSRNLEITIPPTIEPAFGTVCICGNTTFPTGGSCVRRWCTKCHGKLGQWFPIVHCNACITEYVLYRVILADREAHPRWKSNTET